MKVCITTAGAEAGDRLDSRFGRSPCFTFVDTESGDVRTEPNTYADGAGGVGARVAQFIAERGTQAVITAQVGPSAFAVLDAAGIEAYVSTAATVTEALAEFVEGRLERVSSPADPKHSRRS